MAKLFYEIREGSEEAFVELVTKYKSFMINVCYSSLNNSTRAKDLVPKIISMLPNLILRMRDPSCKVKTFLHSICYFTCRNEKRSRKAYANGQFQFALKRTHVAELPAPYPSDLQIIEDREREVVTAMPYIYRQIHYIMRTYGVSHDWISLLLDIPPGTCRRRYHTLNNKLRSDKKLIGLRKEIFGK